MLDLQALFLHIQHTDLHPTGRRMEDAFHKTERKKRRVEADSTTSHNTIIKSLVIL